MKNWFDEIIEQLEDDGEVEETLEWSEYVRDMHRDEFIEQMEYIVGVLDLLCNGNMDMEGTLTDDTPVENDLCRVCREPGDRRSCTFCKMAKARAKLRSIIQTISPDEEKPEIEPSILDRYDLAYCECMISCEDDERERKRKEEKGKEVEALWKEVMDNLDQLNPFELCKIWVSVHTRILGNQPTDTFEKRKFVKQKFIELDLVEKEIEKKCVTPNSICEFLDTIESPEDSRIPYLRIFREDYYEPKQDEKRQYANL